jgi:tRNA (uracil-5-)-methyltransferase TRM9
VDEHTRDKLLDLNRTFYQTFAEEFSSSRQRLQPGVMSLARQISNQANILDLGCGNGQLAKQLFSQGHQALYTGLDSNARFLQIASQSLPERPEITLLHRDLAAGDWDESLPVDLYDLILAFAVLHHLPGTELRQQILSKIAGLAKHGACFIHSEWQLLNSPRLKKRIQSWDTIGIESDKVDEGDYLVDWRAGGQGLRYIHVFDHQELQTLARETGFKITDSFLSDGEGGNLGLYQSWIRL